MGLIADGLRWLASWRREAVVDQRDRTRTLAAELDKLAELMSAVLEVTDADGRIQTDKRSDLELLRKRVWNRWVSILGSSGYATHDKELQAEIEQSIKIAHAAPGAYVEEVYLAQIGIAEGYVSRAVRERFATSIHALNDLTTRMRLNA